MYFSFSLFARQGKRKDTKRKRKHAIVYYALRALNSVRLRRISYARYCCFQQHARGTNANDNEPSPLLPQVTIGLVIVRVYPQQPFNLCPKGIVNNCVLSFSCLLRFILFLYLANKEKE